MFDLIKDVGWDSDYNPEPILKLLEILDEILGVIFVEEEGLDSEVEALIEAREKARADKDFEKADHLRNDLLKKGIELADTPGGTVWKRL